MRFLEEKHDYVLPPAVCEIVSGSSAYNHGLRIKKTASGQSTHYRYNGMDIHAEWNGASMSGAPAAVTVHGGGIDDPAMRLTGQTNDPTAAASFYHQDGINSVVAQTMNTGATQGLQRFDAWGNKTQSTGIIAQYGYTGREPDATGLIYYRARYYDPSIGRFISRDPAGMPDGVNRYAYVGGDPMNNTDPTGMVNWPAAGKSFVDMLGNGAGVVTGGILTAAGVGLVAAPEPTMISKAAGAVTLSTGFANIANSGVGLVNSTRNFISALQDSTANRPTSGLGVLANTYFPGSQTAQDLATVGDLSLALLSGRVPVGTAQINTFSALQQRVPVGINGLLDARGIAVPSGMEGMLLQSADSATSFASMALDVTQLGQLGSLAYDKLLGSTSGNLSLSVISLGTATAPYGGGVSTGVKPEK